MILFLGFNLVVRILLHEPKTGFIFSFRFVEIG